MSTSNSDLNERCTTLRQELKLWEKQFAADHEGRKAGREDIKANAAICKRHGLPFLPALYPAYQVQRKSTKNTIRFATLFPANQAHKHPRKLLGSEKVLRKYCEPRLNVPPAPRGHRKSSSLRQMLIRMLQHTPPSSSLQLVYPLSLVRLHKRMDLSWDFLIYYLRRHPAKRRGQCLEL